MEIFQTVHLTRETLEECLNDDIIFVQFFNSFLALPAFPQQLIYNITSGYFEEFRNTLADDVNGEGNVKEPATLKQKLDYFKTAINEERTKIGYYVKVLEKEKGLQWVLDNRFSLFMKSEKYADYKLVKKLAQAQVQFLYSLLSEYQYESSASDSNSSVNNAFLRSKHHENKERTDQSNEALLYMTSLREKLTERKSVDEWKKILIRQENSFTDIRCDNTTIYEILCYVDKLRGGTRALNVPDQAQEFLDETQNTFPINLLYNEGLTAFKEFLCGTVGEKNLLMWLQLERCKGFDNPGQLRALTHIKERYLQACSPFELSKETLKMLSINDITNITVQSLQAKQDDILAPILKYWCHRFTMHQHKKQKFHSFKYDQNISGTVSSLAGIMEKRIDDAPVRPLSCGGHLRTSSSIKLFQNVANQSDVHCNVLNDSDSGIFSEDGSDVGITRRKLRVKSAYPRLVTSKLPRNTNAGSHQLQLASTFMNEGFGFKAPTLKYYHNDASDAEHKKSVRLYIQPVPPFNATASTIKNKPNFSKEDDLGESFEFQEDLDSLVDMLLHEHHTGNYFLVFLTQQKNKTWLNCYHFWHALQEYNEYFFAESLAPNLISRKANMIYSNFIINNSINDIQCPAHIQVKIHKQLDPPFEELYDVAEQHALTALIQPWSSLTMKENQHYGRLRTEVQLKCIEINRTYNWRYMIEDDEFNGDNGHGDDDDNDDDKISPEEVERPLPLSQDNLNFDSLIRNKTELEHFQHFLESKHKQGILDLTAWTDMEVFRRLPRATSEKSKEMRDKKAMDIREKWLNKNYFFGASTPATKAGLKKILENSDTELLPTRPLSPVITEAQKYSRARVERRWLVMFKQTKEYLERQKRLNNVSEMVEDLLVKKKMQRSEHAWRLLNSRFNTSNRDVASLRVALSHPQECDQFRQFIKVRSEMMENNLHFWLEVQKYKDLCHSHVQDSIIKTKVQTIVDVFIKSDIPPELQIDIPIEIAERLYEKACGKNQQHGPYLFREAQTTVFRIMYNYWKDFVEFRAQASDQVVLAQSLLELQKQRRQDISRKKMMVEKRRLASLVVDKRKREHIFKEREKVKPRDLFSVMANTINTTEHEQEYDVISFCYSKHQAEDELRLLEIRMREEGIPMDDVETRKSTISGFTLKLNSVLGSDRTSTALPASSLKTGSVQTAATNKGRGKDPVRRMSFFNTTGALEMRKISMGVAYNKGEELRDMKNMEKALNDMETKTRYTRFSRNPSAFRFDVKSGITHLSTAKSKMNRSVRGKSKDKKNVKMKTLDQISCVSDLPNINLQKDTKENSKKAQGKLLTKKSLKAFENTPEGQLLKNPLRFVDSVQPPESSYANKETPGMAHHLHDKEEKKETKIKVRNEFKVNPRLPHNAGTASIIAKRMREAPREESPSPVLEAEVIVY